MLILTRGVGEKIIITHGSDEVVITISSFHGKSQVRLGFEASREFSINRKEIWDRIQAGIPKS